MILYNIYEESAYIGPDNSIVLDNGITYEMPDLETAIEKLELLGYRR